MNRAGVSLGRRSLLVALVAAAVGCSSSKAKGRAKASRKKPKGPQTMGGLLVDAYITDVQGKAKEKRIQAARELGAMGGEAKKALPALERMAADKDASVSAAAKRALAAIRAK